MERRFYLKNPFIRSSINSFVYPCFHPSELCCHGSIHRQSRTRDLLLSPSEFFCLATENSSRASWTGTNVCLHVLAFVRLSICQCLSVFLHMLPSATKLWTLTIFQGDVFIWWSQPEPAPSSSQRHHHHRHHHQGWIILLGFLRGEELLTDKTLRST